MEILLLDDELPQRLRVASRVERADHNLSRLVNHGCTFRPWLSTATHASPAVQRAPPSSGKSFIRNATPSPIPGVVTMKLSVVRNMMVPRMPPTIASRGAHRRN